MEKEVYVSFIEYNNWNIFLAATEKGLCYLSTQVHTMNEAQKHLKKYMQNFIIQESDSKTIIYKKQLIDYFEGKRRQFDIPLDLYGTPFQQLVWRSLLEIPYGETTTYQDIGNKIGKPTAARAIGNAIGKNPLLIVVPCHRVIRKNGELGGFREGINLKKYLLEIEKSGQFMT